MVVRGNKHGKENDFQDDHMGQDEATGESTRDGTGKHCGSFGYYLEK